MTTKLRFGHAGEHERNAAGAAFHAWLDWDGIGPEPAVPYNYEPDDLITISRACGLVWNCTDIMPGQLCDWLIEDGLDIKHRTYAACAQAIVARIKTRTQQAA
jgi:hypothetical protein